MKTTRTYPASLLLLTIILVTGLNATTLFAKSSIDNPPTSYNEYKDTTPDFDFADEAYIDDIPFNTECVTKNCLYEKAVSEVFILPEEGYIKDIPFNTAKIAKREQNQYTSKNEIQLEEEEYIDDIPFNTVKIINDMNDLIILVKYAK